MCLVARGYPNTLLAGIMYQNSGNPSTVSGTPSGSITVYNSKTNATSINRLEGLGYQIGGSTAAVVGCIPFAGGVDCNIIPDSKTGKYYYGITTSAGIGVPGAEFHVEWGNTTTLRTTEFNIFDSIDQICIDIMEW